MHAGLITTVLDSLVTVGDDVSAAVPAPSAIESSFLEALQRQLKRLAEERIQLAVVGLAKRGKSTLANALIGEMLLIADVLPATAIPTFVTRGGELGLSLVHSDGRAERVVPADVHELRAQIAAAANEEGNPENRLRLDRVEVTLPGSKLPEGLTLIDTPGVGSAHGHNTRSAHAALPECDAALFVVAVDPPITEVELSFLETVCTSTRRVVVALNKMDAVSGKDASRLSNYVREQIARRISVRPPLLVFPISARTALAARWSDDAGELAASGLPELEDAIRTGLVGDKQALLAKSICSKVRTIVAELFAIAQVRVRSLAMPLDDLDRRIAELAGCAARFDLELRALRDGLEGERRRALERLDMICTELAQRDSKIVATLTRSDDADMRTRMSDLFDPEFQAAAKEIGAMVDDVVATCRNRYAELVRATRVAAGALAEVAMPEAPTIDFELPRKPFWAGRVEVDDVTSLTADRIYRILPRTMQVRRTQDRLRQAIERAVLRNISDMNWTARQTIDDAFRRLLAQASNIAVAGPDAVQGVLLAVRQVRCSEEAVLDRTLAAAHLQADALTGALDRLDLILHMSSPEEGGS